jgi:predicted RNase H-like HicB family nuclease
MKFKVALYTSEEGVAVNVPSLPGCWSQGATVEEALENIAEAIREYLEADVEPAEGAELSEVDVTMSWFPAPEEVPRLHVGSPRLAQAERAADFTLEVAEESQHAEPG